MNIKIIIAICVFAVFVFLLVWTQSQSSKIAKEPEEIPAIVAAVVEPPKKIPTGEVTRRTRVQRSSEFIENIFYIGEEIVARQKVFADGKVEDEGTIPEGSIKFSDEYDQSYGVEYYYQGKKHGSVKTYSQDGSLKSDAQYVYGQLVKNKEYYPNGIARFEFDNTDAILGGNQKEVGIGKLYYPNGKLKYEWNLTRLNKGGYKRSYNQDGTLRSESRFNEYGQFLNEVKPPVVEPIVEPVAEPVAQ